MSEHMGEVVWMVSGWQGTAHSPKTSGSSGAWTTRCGRPIYVKDELPRTRGVHILWAFLDHSKVKRCKVCFR